MKVRTPDGFADTGLANRRGVVADLRSLVELDRLCFGDRAWPARAWREVLVGEGWEVTVVSSAGLIIAASVVGVTPPVAHLASLAVHPAWRRQGLARQLVTAAIALSRPVVRALHLEVDADNRDAVRLYRRFGFVPVRRFVEDRLVRVEMVRRLRASRRAS